MCFYPAPCHIPDGASLTRSAWSAPQVIRPRLLKYFTAVCMLHCAGAATLPSYNIPAKAATIEAQAATIGAQAATIEAQAAAIKALQAEQVHSAI